VRYIYICFNGKHLSKSFQETPYPKKVQYCLQGDLMQFVQIVVPGGREGPQ
jgi:hypothetical protein